MIKDIDISKTFSFRAFVSIDDSLLSEDVEDYLDSYNLTCFLKLGTASDLDNSLFCTDTVGKYYFQIRLFNSDSKEVYIDKLIYFNIVRSYNSGIVLRNTDDIKDLEDLKDFYNLRSSSCFNYFEVFKEVDYSETCFPYTAFSYNNKVGGDISCCQVIVWFKENIDCSLFFRHLVEFLSFFDFLDDV